MGDLTPLTDAQLAAIAERLERERTVEMSLMDRLGLLDEITGYIPDLLASHAALAARLAEAERERDVAQASLTMLRHAIDSLSFLEEETDR